MSEITFLSNKTKKETLKYVFVILFAVITWILQVSIFSHFLCFDTSPNLLLLGCIYFGLTMGPVFGSIYGIIVSFFSSSLLYDHTFYFSYPLLGFLSGLLIKNLFSDELIFFVLLSSLFTLLFELLNGWQYSLTNPINIFDRFILVGLVGAMINLVFAPIYYLIMTFITKKLNIK